MNKLELTQIVKKENDLTASEAKVVVDLLFDKLQKPLPTVRGSRSGACALFMSRNTRDILDAIPKLVSKLRSSLRNSHSSNVARSLRNWLIGRALVKSLHVGSID